MSHRPADANRFLFVVMSGLRAAQLTRGCIPRIMGPHKNTVIAQLEVAAGLVKRDVDTLLARID